MNLFDHVPIYLTAFKNYFCQCSEEKSKEDHYTHNWSKLTLDNFIAYILTIDLAN
mgnify:FL=1